MSCRERDILDNMGLVYKIAHSMRPTHTNSFVGFDDLVSEGTLGLMDALDKYSPKRGVKFSTYAAIRIRGQMLDAYRGSFWQKRAGHRRGLPAPSYVYLDANSPEDTEALHGLVPGKFLSEQDLINRIDVRLVWKGVWQQLRPKEKEVVELMLSGLIQKEVAGVLGVTESRVSQAYCRALASLRDYHSKSRR